MVGDRQRDAVGVGVVGTGFGASVVAPAFAALDAAEVRAICSADPDRAAAAAQRLGVPFSTHDPAALLARADIDLVCVAAPPHRHCALVVAALEAGKHVVCEKPFGVDVDEAERMLHTAEQAGRLHFVDFEFRTVPARRALGALIRSGELGEIRHVVVTAMVAGERFPVMNRPGWWQDADRGGGWLGAMGSHYLDALRVWLGEIREVSASLETRRRNLDDGAGGAVAVTADDGFMALLRSESGVACTLVTASSVRNEIGPRVEVYGSQGTAVLEGDARLSVGRGDHELAPVEVAGADPGGDPAAHPSRGPLGVWAGTVVDAVRAGRQIAPSFEDGVRCQEVMAAIRASSADAGRWTRVGTAD
jgi:predicted dehydrogenase